MNYDSNQQNRKKIDWSRTNFIRKIGTNTSSERETGSPTIDQADLQPNGRSTVPTAPTVPLPDTSAQRGIVMQWRESKLGRKAALQALEAHYNGQLEALKHSVAKAVQVHKARADVIASEYLRELDSRHLAMMAELGLRNKETRERALLQLTDMTTARLAEVQDKDWPEELISETIDELFALRRRVVTEMMKELGSDYSNT